MTKRKALGEFLSKALARPGASQAGLARDLGVTRSTVHLWVTGKRTPPETYRGALRNAARGHSVTAPPPPTTKAGTPRRTRGSVTRKSVGGQTHVKARALSSFASELSSLAGGSRAALEDLITRTVHARGYTGGFTYDRATGFDFQV